MQQSTDKNLSSIKGKILTEMYLTLFMGLGVGILAAFVLSSVVFLLNSGS